MSNPPRINDQALPTLEAMTRFWQFKRKQLAADLQGHLLDAQQQLDNLFSANQQLTVRCAGQASDLGFLQSRNESLLDQLQVESANLSTANETLEQEKTKLQKAMLALSKAQVYARDLEERQARALAQLAELEQRLADQANAAQVEREVLAERLQAKQAKVADLEQRNAQARAQITELETFLEEHKSKLLAKEENVSLLENLTEQLKASHQHLVDNYEDINTRHLSLTEKFSLVSKVLAQQPPTNAALDEFAALINHDYMEFASRESSLAGEAQAVLEMQAILAEMQMLNNFPSIAGKTVLSVAGGFSSGKSAFLNSFIQNPGVQLATGINPVTVVPSYVVCSEETRIKGYSYNGGSLDLEPKLYASMCHEYVKAFGFDLRRILPFISVKVPMDPELFGNLCIIDTPGYNPGNAGGAAAADRGTAASLVNQASAMIWVIGLDPAGTIDQSDIEFIQATRFHGESLYIVLNKADVKSNDDIEEIMDQVAFDLECAGVGYAGMCAYSSVRRKDYPCTGLTLAEFLRSINHKVDVVGKIDKKLNAVFDAYQRAIEADIAQLEGRKGEFNAFKLDALEVGGTALFDRIDQAFPLTEQMFDTSTLEKLVGECQNLRGKLRKAAAKALA
ncbi:hypothetical protein DCO48_06530 [Pseudomonas sp. SDI]|uniref:dynamin family protein n=1 Tax=Pseudomonas sp. SDI TaxID=2170734 RepID=UPI000DE747DD|nr:dynamin family protein [Pseudomonas sp. SDI]PWB34351.1 hypothetical protein DCO48_06530 [Pseudomonas sp. SDI]